MVRLRLITSCSAIFPEAGELAPDAPPDRRPPAAQVRDFIAGMTDDYFLAQPAALGCRIPTKVSGPLVG